MLIALSIDHRSSTVEDREPFALPPVECTRLARLVRRACGGQVVFLVTCNRVEIHTWVTAPNSTQGLAWIEQIAGRIAPGLAERFLTRATVYSGQSAARHLLRVTAGLESQVEGDVQVLGQVRAAYGRSAECGCVGAELHRLCQTALRTGKRVHAETPFGERRASVGALAAAEVDRRLARSGTRRVVVLGAGKTAESAARGLVKRGLAVTIVNRTPERAGALALRLGAMTGRFEERHDLIAGADAAIIATGAAEPTVLRTALGNALDGTGRRGDHLWIVDLAVPRNVEPAAGLLAGVTLTGLEGFPAAGSRLVPSEDRSAAEQIVAQELGSFVAWLSARQSHFRIVA